MSASTPKSTSFIAALKRSRRISPAVAAIVATIITAAVAIPLALRATGIEAPAGDPIYAQAPHNVLTVSPASPNAAAVGAGAGAGAGEDGGAGGAGGGTAGGAQSSILDGSVISGDVYITYQDKEAQAVAFALFSAGSDQTIMSSQDESGPIFSLVTGGDKDDVSAFDTTLLDDGTYELFITVIDRQVQRRTAVSFEVVNRP